MFTWYLCDEALPFGGLPVIGYGLSVIGYRSIVADGTCAACTLEEPITDNSLPQLPHVLSTSSSFRMSTEIVPSSSEGLNIVLNFAPQTISSTL